MATKSFVSTSQVSIIPYARRYRRDVLGLLDEEDRLHIHLDWNTVDEWIGEPDLPLYLAWQAGQHGQLLGAIAASPPLEGGTWLRMVALGEGVDADQVLALLWNRLREDLLGRGVHEVAILLIRAWITPHVQRLGFAPRDSIVTLRRNGSSAPPPLRSDIKVRSADWRELPQVVDVDHAAFRSIWQLTTPALRQASRMASSFRVAELDRRILAYQLSTLYRDGGHLARLATLPEVQGQGIGGALLGDLIEQFDRRGIYGLTVNTNESNVQSLRLYRRYGFELTGMNMDVWSVNI